MWNLSTRLSRDFTIRLHVFGFLLVYKQREISATSTSLSTPVHKRCRVLESCSLVGSSDISPSSTICVHKKERKAKTHAAGVIKECLNETTLHQMRAFISRWKVEEETRKSSSLLLLLLFVEMHFSELPRLRSFFWFCDVVSCTPLPSVFFFYVYKKKGQVCCSSMLSLASRQQWPTIAVTKAGGSLNLGYGQRQTAASRPIGRRRKNAS